MRVPDAVAALSPQEHARNANASDIPSQTPLFQRRGPRGLWAISGSEPSYVTFSIR